MLFRARARRRVCVRAGREFIDGRGHKNAGDAELTELRADTAEHCRT